MLNIFRVWMRELRWYISSPSSYIFLLLFLIISSSLMIFLNRFFAFGVARLDGFFVYIPWLLLFFIPAIGMRLWAEEKKSGTIELLMTLPVLDLEVVLGKYFGALTLLLVALVLTFPVPWMVAAMADPNTPLDWGPVFCAYLASFLLGAVILGISAWVSSITENQIIAFILGCSITFTLYLLGFPSMVSLLPDWLGSISSRLSPYQHFSSLYQGVIEVADIVYFLSAIVLFLYLNVRSIESRKWA